MALEVNGAAILAAISKSPEAFAMTESQVNALAQAALVGRFKDKALSLEQLRAMTGHLDKHDLALSLDGLKATELSALAKRLDPKNTALKTIEDHQRRALVVALAYGQADPSVAPAKAAKAAKPKAEPAGSKTGKAMQSKALRTRRTK